MNSDNMFQLGNLAMSIQGAEGLGTNDEATDNEASSEMFDNKENGDSYNESGPPSDLFTEIHGGEMKKLEKKIETAENDKIGLNKSLSEKAGELERAKNEIRAYQANLVQLGSHLAALQQLQNESKKKPSTQV